MNKKAQAGLIAIVIILIALVFLGWLVKLGSRECNSNKDCREDNYCGSDFNCHEIPIIEKTVVKRSYTAPVLIVAITAIIIAIIFNWEKIFKKRVKPETTEKIETPEETESYYTSQFQYTAK